MSGGIRHIQKNIVFGNMEMLIKAVTLWEMKPDCMG